MAPADPLQPFMQAAIGNGFAKMGFKAWPQIVDTFKRGFTFDPLAESVNIFHFMAMPGVRLWPGVKTAGFRLEGQPFIQGCAGYGKRFTYV